MYSWEKYNSTAVILFLLFQKNKQFDLLISVITGDESCLYCYDIETKVQSSQWKRPEEQRSKKAHQVRSNVKVLLTVFIDCNGVLHYLATRSYGQ